MPNPEKFEPRFKPEIQEESAGEKEKSEIEVIEQSSLSFQDKEDLLLVYLKEKPASWIGAGVRFYKTETKEKKEEKLKRLNQKGKETERALENLSLPNHIYKFETEEEKTVLASYDFLVGQDLEKLNRLKEALKSGATKEIGLALGYPESAVEGFIKGEVFDREKDLKRLPKKEKAELKKDEVFKFLTFGLSKDNWRKELELVRKYQKVIREKSPKIYNEVIKNARDPFTFRGRLKTSLEKILNKIEYYKRSFKK